MSGGPIFKDGNGNVIEREPVVARSASPSVDEATRLGVTFHRQPCGAFVASDVEGRRRVCGLAPEPARGFWSVQDQDEKAKDPYDGSARRARWWRKAWDMGHLHRTACSGCGRIGWTADGRHHMTSEEVGVCSCGRSDVKIRCPPGCAGL